MTNVSLLNAEGQSGQFRHLPFFTEEILTKRNLTNLHYLSSIPCLLYPSPFIPFEGCFALSSQTIKFDITHFWFLPKNCLSLDGLTCCPFDPSWFNIIPQIIYFYHSKLCLLVVMSEISPNMHLSCLRLHASCLGILLLSIQLFAIWRTNVPSPLTSNPPN